MGSYMIKVAKMLGVELEEVFQLSMREFSMILVLN